MKSIKRAIDLVKEKVDVTAVAVNTVACLVLVLFYALIFSYILPAGINQYFSQRLITLMPIPVMIAMYFVLFILQRHKPSVIKVNKPNFEIEYKDLLLLLIPMTPVVRYIFLNMDILNFYQGAFVFIVFLVIAFALTFLIPLIFQYIGSKIFLMMAGLSYSYLIFNMAALASDFSWHLRGSLRVQLPVLIIATLLTSIIYSKDKKYLRIASFVFFAAGLIAMGGASSVRSVVAPESELYQTLIESNPIHKPDIFLLTYESYVENETMLQYGIDNSEQEDFLLENGFTIYRGTYTLGPASLSSMGRVLNVTEELDYRMATSGNGVVQNALSALGYETYGIFKGGYFFRGKGAFYDYSYPAEINQYLLVARQILEGEFRFDAELSFNKVEYSEYLSEKRYILSNNNGAPVFLYSHNSYPGHSQNSGQCLDNEVELYKEKLIIANEEMKVDVELVIKNNPNAIIIVCGDHGPYLTKNCTSTGANYDINEITRLDIQDRFGSFLAIRWPDEDQIDHNDIGILQDVFPVVFALMYDNQDILNFRLERTTLYPKSISGVEVRDGYIFGGADHSLPLFDSNGIDR